MRRNDREISDSKLIEDIISKADVCRIALADNNIPYIVTMNFGYSKFPGPKLFFHCADEGRKLEMIRKNNYVCFEMDTDHQLSEGKKGCDWSMGYSSVIGYGNISIITEKEAKREGLNCIMAHYSNSAEFLFNENILEQTTVLCLDIREITGKKKTL